MVCERLAQLFGTVSMAIDDLNQNVRCMRITLWFGAPSQGGAAEEDSKKTPKKGTDPLSGRLCTDAGKAKYARNSGIDTQEDLSLHPAALLVGEGIVQVMIVRLPRLNLVFCDGTVLLVLRFEF